MADKPIPVDKLSGEELARRYQFAYNIIYGNEELRRLFEQAVEGQWQKDEFDAKLMATTWYQENNEFARAAATAQSAGGADWVATQENANLAIQKEATRLGVKLTPDELFSLSSQYLFEGWGDPRRTTKLTEALSKHITTPPTGTLAGVSGDLQSQLRSIAAANGLKLDDNYYLSAARSVASGLSTANDWIREVRDQAASLYPAAWRDKILGGANANDLASGYVSTLSQTLELDRNTIDLNNSYIKQALSAVNENGQPMGLWDFEKMLRNTPQWMNTKQAQQQITDTGMQALQMMGFMA